MELPGEKVAEKLGEARQPGPSVQDYLDRETRPVPAYLRDNPYRYLGSEDLPVGRWIDRSFHDLEMKHVWPRVWQLACMIDDIPNVGDYVTYDIGNHSFIVTRQRDGGIKALYNSCLHRATQLTQGSGNTQAFRCPFHGWVYGLDGQLTGLPCAWDFTHMTSKDRKMPEARVAVWQGLVFLNLDPDAPDLETYIGDLHGAYDRYPLSGKRKSAHVQKTLACNWKISLEQFIESYHLLGTHPEGLPYISDANAQYNIWPGNDHVSRMHALHSVSSPHVAGRYSEQEIMDIITSISDKAGTGDIKVLVPDGSTARETLAQKRRDQLTELGIESAALTDAEMLDTIHYLIFPNIVVWTAYGSSIIYWFRPNGDDHSTSVLDILFLAPYDQRGPKPPPTPITRLDADASWTESPELGRLGWVFDQDVHNAPLVQRGMKASGKGTVSLANYQEIRIRHLHATLDKYITGEI